MNEIEVKALEWTALREGDEVAESILGTYTITGGSVFFVWFAGQADYEDYALEAPSMEAAKAAAKADYEQRILSALTTSPTPPAEPVIHDALDRLEKFPLTKLVNTSCTDVHAMWDTAADTQRRADLDWLRAAISHASEDER